jgi:cobalamin biosynthesis Mg chelatase CobN
MVNRANNYMTLAFVKIPSMVLCLSYKGQGKRNIEDVHDLVFRMPTLEYRNKTWSNLDLALQLKKDVIRALISHAGAIVSNKFSHHKPNRLQQSRLREIANMSTFMSPKASTNALDSESSSMMESNSTERTGRPSSASAHPSTLNRSISMGSTPSGSSTTELKTSDDASGEIKGEPNGQSTLRRKRSVPRSSSASADPDVRVLSEDPPNAMVANRMQQSRPRAASITRHLSGFGDRLRQLNTDSSNNDDTEENRRKSKLLLGGQKLLGKLRD